MKRIFLCAAFFAMLTGSLMAQNYEYSVVPALSSLKRLPTTPPVDGKVSGTLSFVAAKGELESASFVMRSDYDAKKVILVPGDLKNAKGGVIPASAIDLKVVKVWVQGGCAWHSYFADATGRELVPELLLNDETLVKVDKPKMENYLRVVNQDGKTEYVWISNPDTIDVPFSTWKNKIADSQKFQSFTLDKNNWKQIWVTLDAPKNAEGLYKGEIKVTIDGKAAKSIPVSVRVLPFELPEPMTHYDLTRKYYTSSYNNARLNVYLKENEGDMAAAEKRLRSVYQNYRRHNVMNPMILTSRDNNDDLFRKQLSIYKESGLDTSTLFDAVRGIPDYGYLTNKDRQKPVAEQALPANWEKETLTGKKIVEEMFGKNTTIYCFGWDEPGMGILRAQRKPWSFLHDNGLKTYSTAHEKHLLHGGYNEDFVNYGGHYSKEQAALWHAFGAKITSYASPHTGIENPDIVRRNHGIDLYLADQDGTNNYTIDESPWNDFLGASYNFRAFNWTYPGTIEPVNTIQFAGFREAIDDVKYATLLQQLANKAIATGKTENIYAGRIALQYLTLINGQKADLDTVRLELINHIMRLREIVK